MVQSCLGYDFISDRAGEAVGLLCRNLAATPATWGVAIDVPLSVAVAVSLVRHAETMPGTQPVSAF
jgi:hypothetical protein